MAADVAQRESSRIKRYVSAFSNIVIWLIILKILEVCLSFYKFTRSYSRGFQQIYIFFIMLVVLLVFSLF